MKKILFTLILLSNTLEIISQTYTVSYPHMFTDNVPVFIYGQYRIGPDGLYSFYGNEEGMLITNQDYNTYSDTKESFFSYDKKSNKFYFYSDNTIGYCQPEDLHKINQIKNTLKNNNVKSLNEKETQIIIQNLLNKLHSNYSNKNDIISKDLKIQREKAIQEKEEFRKNNDWHKLSFSKEQKIYCNQCQKYHNDFVFNIVSLSADTMYFILPKPDFRILDYSYNPIHYAQISNSFKANNDFIKYVEIWNDSIANNNNFSTEKANNINAFNLYNICSAIQKIAPYGFVQRSGCNINHVAGIEPYFAFFNASEKTIKYIEFFFNVINEVGDKCYFKYEKSFIGSVKGVGPINPMETGSWHWDRATHYTTDDATRLIIIKIIVTYMDNTTKTLTGNNIIYGSIYD